MKFEETEIAWAAGFFDGEGCVQAYQANRYLMATKLVAHNRDIRPLKRLRAVFGGTITTEKKMTEAAIWKWQISGDASTEFAKAILDHSTAKYEQLEYYIELRETIRDGQKSGGVKYPSSVVRRRVKLIREIKSCKAKVNRKSVLP